MKAPGTAYDDAAPRQGPAAGALARLRAHVRGQRRRPHQLRHPEPAPSTCSPPSSAAGRGSAPGHIWYDALRSPLLTPTATFRQFARITHRAARQRFGPGSDAGEGRPRGVGRGGRPLGMRIEVRRRAGSRARAPPGRWSSRPRSSSRADARELEALAADLPAGGPPGRGADLMRYDVLVDDASGRRTATFFETERARRRCARCYVWPARLAGRHVAPPAPPRPSRSAGRPR